MRLWLSNKVFEWAYTVDSGRSTDIERVKRPHSMLSHCERVLASSDTEFSIADAILGLKRAINSRLQHIEELYGLSKLFAHKVGALERLERVGLVRPFLVKQLFELRNDIEHHDAPPPDQHRVRELVDLTWYFLRTTDYACKLVPEGIVLRTGEEGLSPPEQWLHIRPSSRYPTQFEITGWVHKNLLTEVAHEDSFEIQVETIKDKNSFATNLNHKIAAISSHNLARSEDERWIVASSELSLELQLELWRLALDAL